VLSLAASELGVSVSLGKTWTLGALGVMVAATASATGASPTVLKQRVVAAQTAPLAYHVTDVGTLGGRGTVANAINASGALAGGIQEASGETFAFQYLHAATRIGMLPGYSGSVAQGVNASGQVTGGTWTEPGIYSGYHAFVYSRGVVTDLGTFGGPYSYGRAINDRGDVAGESNFTNSTYPPSYPHAFLYSAGKMHDLGVLGYGQSFGYGINNYDQVVGWSNVGFNNQVHAFLYTGGAMHDLGSLGGGLSEAYAINDPGQVTGYSTTSSYDSHAFLYSRGKMIDLGTLGRPPSYGYGINAAGNVVGTSALRGSFDNFHGFVAIGAKMYDLNNLLDRASRAFLIVNATGINASGQIAADATLNGVSHAVLLTPV